MTDLLLDQNDDLDFTGGDFNLGESTLQDVGIILRLNQGDLKTDPVMGPNLIRFIKRPVSQEKVDALVKLNLARDGKDYKEIKKYVTINGK